MTANDQAMDEGAGTRAGGNMTGGLALAGAVILGIISAVIAIVYAMRRKKNKPSEH